MSLTEMIRLILLDNNNLDNFKFVVTPRPAASGTFLPFRRILSETAVS